MNSLAALKQSGWLHAVFVGVVAYPIGNIASRLGVAEYGAHPIAYAAVSMLAASISLMLVARPGTLGIETLQQPATWLYGVLNTLAFTFAVMVAVYVSATQVSLLTSVPIVVVYLLAYLFLREASNPREWLGLGMIALAVLYLLLKINLPVTDLIQLCVLLFALGLAQALQKIVAERHRTNRAAATFEQNMRVTAVVMGVTSAMFIFLFLGIAYLKHISGVPLWPGAPALSDFVSWPMFVLALVVGMLVRSPSKYCEFYATKKITAKHFLAVTAVQPIFTLLYEMLLNALGLAHMIPLTSADFISLIVVVAGSLVLAFAGFKSGRVSNPDAYDLILDPRVNAALQQTVALTLTFTGGSKTKAARLLGIDVNTLRNILADKAHSLQFTRHFARDLQEHFAANVAMADPLTGLQNRLQFTTALTQKLRGKTPVHVALLDLNKFKPINDTYGHAAGDAVLKMVAKRLKTLAPKGAVVARLGGDEFAIFSTTKLPTKTILAKLAAPYKTPLGTFHTSASLGLATSGHDGSTPDALLVAADKRMYSDKKDK